MGTSQTLVAQGVDRSDTTSAKIDPKGDKQVPEASSRSIDTPKDCIKASGYIDSENIESEKFNKLSVSTPEEFSPEQHCVKEIDEGGSNNDHVENVPSELGNEQQQSSCTSDLKLWEQRLAELRALGELLSENAGCCVDRTTAQRHYLASPVSVHAVSNDGEFWKDGVHTLVTWPLALDEVNQDAERQRWLMRLRKCAGTSDAHDNLSCVDSQDETKDEKAGEKAIVANDVSGANAEKVIYCRDQTTAERSESTEEHDQLNKYMSSTSNEIMAPETALVSSDAAPDVVVHKRFEWVALREGNLNDGSTRMGREPMGLPSQAEPKATASRAMDKHSDGRDVGDNKSSMSADAKNGGSTLDGAKAESKGQSNRCSAYSSSAKSSSHNGQILERLPWPSGGLALPNPDGCDPAEGNSQESGSWWPWGQARSSLTAQPRRQSSYSRRDHK